MSARIGPPVIIAFAEQPTLARLTGDQDRRAGRTRPEGSGGISRGLGYRRFDCTGDDPASIADAYEAARQAISDGECIVLPTDTVYGIGVDAFSAEAVQRLLDAKNRGRDMPPPVLIAEPVLFRTLAGRCARDSRGSCQQTLAWRTNGNLPNPTQPANRSR